MRSHSNRMRKKRYRILIIDDDESDRKLYKKFIESADSSAEYDFREAVTGEEGLNLYAQAKPDCVLLDNLLPDITGVALLKELARVTPVLTRT